MKIKRNTQILKERYVGDYTTLICFENVHIRIQWKLQVMFDHFLLSYKKAKSILSKPDVA